MNPRAKISPFGPKPLAVGEYIILDVVLCSPMIEFSSPSWEARP